LHLACEVQPPTSLRVLQYLRNRLGLERGEVGAWYRHWIAEGFQMLEAFLAQEKKHGKYCYREQVTVADCCLVPQVFNAILYKCDLKPYPTLMRIHEACMKLDAFVLAQPSKQPDAA
jgi:maleylacetoacetate isomerase